MITRKHRMFRRTQHQRRVEGITHYANKHFHTPGPVPVVLAVALLNSNVPSCKIIQLWFDVLRLSAQPIPSLPPWSAQ